MRLDLVERRIKKVSSSVRTIERLRSDLFVKYLPPLFQDGYARLVITPPASWVVVTIDREFLAKIDAVRLDYTDPDPKRYLKFFDADGNELYPPPRDIVALFTLSEERVIKDVKANLSEAYDDDGERSENR